MSARAPRRAARLLLTTTVSSIALAGVLAGCGDVSWAPPATPVTGAGDVQTEDRTTGDFTRISIGSGIKVVVGTADATKVTVQAQSNVLPLVTTTVVDGQLVVNTSAPGFTAAQPVTITIKAPVIGSLAISGGSTGFFESTAGSLNIDVSGASTLTGIGTAKDLTLTTSAGSKADLSQLKVGGARVTMSDGSSATMTVSGAVSGTASGGSTLTLTQAPASSSVQTSGGATVQAP